MVLDAMSRDVHNSCAYDFSGSTPEEIVFKGDQRGFALLRPDASGIERISYKAGPLLRARITKTVIGRRVRSVKEAGFSSVQEDPVESVTRVSQVLTAADDAGARAKPMAIVKKDSFSCRYAAWQEQGKALSWKEQWNDGKLPAAVECRFSLYDPNAPGADIWLGRRMYVLNGQSPS